MLFTEIMFETIRAVSNVSDSASVSFHYSDLFDLLVCRSNIQFYNKYVSLWMQDKIKLPTMDNERS